MNNVDYNKIKKEKLELNYKIKKIDNILDSSENMEDYINIIENSKFDTPENLSDVIKKKLNLNDEKEEKQNIIRFENTNKNKNKNKDNIGKEKLNIKFFDKVKIAACTLCAVAIFEITMSGNMPTYANKDKNISNIEIYTKIDSIVKNVSDFFTTPIIFERGGK